MPATSVVKPIQVLPDALQVLDQRALPARRWLTLRTRPPVAEAIRSLAVRGAPLLGAAASYGLWLARCRRETPEPPRSARPSTSTMTCWRKAVPPAVNLFAALDRSMHALTGRFRRQRRPHRLPPSHRGRICAEDALACLALSEQGAHLLPDEGGVLTHCNAGALATCGIGTALV